MWAGSIQWLVNIVKPIFEVVWGIYKEKGVTIMGMIKHVVLTALLLTTTLSAKDEIKQSHFEDWIECTSDHLCNDIRRTIVPAAMGAVQVYRKDHEAPYLLVLHGAFGGWDQGKVLGEHYSHEGFSIVAPSRPGYLGSTLPPSTYLNAAEQADLMVEVLDKLNIDKTAVLGFGIGAAVAYELAKNHPDRVTALVLESIGSSGLEDTFFQEVLSPVLMDVETADFYTYLTYLADRFDAYSTYVEALEGDTYLTGTDFFHRAKYVTKSEKQRVLIKDFINSTIPISPRINGIWNDLQINDYWNSVFAVPVGFSVPTIIVQSPDDSNGYFSTAQEVAQTIPGARLISVPSAGHMIWLGPNVKDWQKEVSKFLKSNS